MMGLASRVQNEASGTTPVLINDRGANSMQIDRGVRSRERRPQPVVLVLSREAGIVDEQEEGKSIHEMRRREGVQKPGNTP